MSLLKNRHWTVDDWKRVLGMDECKHGENLMIWDCFGASKVGFTWGARNNDPGSCHCFTTSCYVQHLFGITFIMQLENHPKNFAKLCNTYLNKKLGRYLKEKKIVQH